MRGWNPGRQVVKRRGGPQQQLAPHARPVPVVIRNRRYIDLSRTPVYIYPASVRFGYGLKRCRAVSRLDEKRRVEASPGAGESHGPFPGAGGRFWRPKPKL